jgi:hypothetical protein
MQVRQENTLKRMEQDYDVRMEEQVGELREKMRLLRKFARCYKIYFCKE